MRVFYDKTTDGRKLIRVIFDRQSADAATVTMEVVYAVEYPDDFRLTENIPVLTLVSTTRVDTREKVVLRKEELDQAHRDAAVKAVEAVNSDWQ